MATHYPFVIKCQEDINVIGGPIFYRPAYNIHGTSGTTQLKKINCAHRTVLDVKGIERLALFETLETGQLSDNHINFYVSIPLATYLFELVNCYIAVIDTKLYCYFEQYLETEILNTSSMIEVLEIMLPI